ncbi:MAG: ArnT family glycosyltransferase [Solirubrobacteraceae bacterium]
MATAIDPAVLPAAPRRAASVVSAPARTSLRQSLAVGGVAALVKLATALPFLAHYGWDRDELYFLQASRHLGLGYVDFPVATAAIGRAVVDLAGPSLVALRLTGVVATMLAAVLVGLCARELGGGVGAQGVAALAFVLTPYGLAGGTIFHPTMFDLLVWVAFGYVALRILLRPERRLWPWLGVIAGVGLETKGTVAALILAFAAGLVVVGPRRMLATRGPWVAALIALTCLLPYLGWQAAHGWPTLTFLPSQDAVTAASTSRSTYVVQQLAFVGPALVLVALGVRRLWRDPSLRALAVLAPATAVLFFLEQGRAYYSLPAIALPLAAGAVTADGWWSARRRDGRRGRRAALAGALAAGQLAVVAAAGPLVWPVLPIATMVKLGVWHAGWYKDELGWPELAAETARAWRAIPAAQRADTALLARDYGEAGALDLYGPSLGLPQALSGHLSFQYWHPARMPQRHVLAVGFDEETLRGLCRAQQVVARIDNRWRLANEEEGRSIETCTLRAPLGAMWASRIATDRL